MRLLWFDQGRRSGPENMRRDRALLGCAETGRLPDPILVVYGWHPAAVSLGFHQPEAGLDLEAVRRAGIDVVRRPTGGAAVLHDQEITYALVGPLGLTGLGRSVRSIYDGVADALVEVLRGRGVDATRGGGGRPTGFACFAQAGGHEITVRGRKLVGSALRKGRCAFLQHGSLLTGPGHLELIRFAGSGIEDPAPVDQCRRQLAAKTIDLMALGVDLSAGEGFGEELAAALARRMGIESRPLDALPSCVVQEMEGARPDRSTGRS